MNIKLHHIPFLIITLLAITSCTEETQVTENTENDSGNKVLIIGASITEDWDISNLPTRVNNYTYSFDHVTDYTADKSETISKLLTQNSKRPDAIVFKQCAAYFDANVSNYEPTEVNKYKKYIESWVKKSRDKGIQPVLATVVPITEEMPAWPKTKRFIKERILRWDVPLDNRQARQQALMVYNDWLREYAKQNNVLILDLEKPLRISKSNRYLDPKYTTDGLHINKEGYKQLDKIVIQSLEVK